MFKNENLIFSTVNAAQSDQVDVNKKKKKEPFFPSLLFVICVWQTSYVSYTIELGV